MAGHSGGPWGGGGNNGSGDDDRGTRGGGGRRPGEDKPQIPEIDELMKKGQEQLRVLMGGRGGGDGARGGGGGGQGPSLNRGSIGIGILAVLALWLYASFYTVKPEEQSVELFLGEYYSTGNPGLNFAPWPVVTAEVVNVTSERTENIGGGRGGAGGDGLMLTTDANIVDIDFQVVWNINDPAKLLFNIRDPQLTVQAVSEAVMREIIAASNLAPILNRDRGIIADTARENIQTTLNDYASGITVVRVNLDTADPPRDVIDAFREVQAAEQERDRLQRQADAYANRVLAEARGSGAQIIQEAEGYRAQVVNEAIGEASRFIAVAQEFNQAPEVTQRRLYLETVERTLGEMDKILLDEGVGDSGQGVLPYLPLNELRRSGQSGTGGSN